MASNKRPAAKSATPRKIDSKSKTAPESAISYASAQSGHLSVTPEGFSNPITLHTDMRVFSVTVLYRFKPHCGTALGSRVYESVAAAEHMIEVAIAGPRFGEDVDIPDFPRYAEINEYHGEVAKAVGHGSIVPQHIEDTEAAYYGSVVADRVVLDNDYQIQILAVTVSETHLPQLFLNATAG